MTRVLVTGPSGFLGPHCLRRLLAEDCEIHAVNRTGRGAINDRLHWHAADLRDAGQTTKLIAQIRPTHLLHCAWVATPHVYRDSPENETWLQASLALAQAFGEHGGLRFVGIGSAAEYEPDSNLCIEDQTPIRPASIYGKCKAAFWQGLQLAAQRGGFTAAWGRVFLLYGPGDPPSRLIPTVIAALGDKKPVPTTQGHQVRDFIHALDAADLLIRILMSPEVGAFNVGTGRATTVRSVIEYIADRFQQRQLLRFGAVDLPYNEATTLVADMTKVNAQLRWSASTSIEQGLDKLLMRHFLGEESPGAAPYLIVEEIADYCALRWVMNRHASSLGPLSLIPGGGTGASGPLVKLLLERGERFLLVLDDDSAGRAAASRYRSDWRLPDGAVQTLEEIDARYKGLKLEGLISSHTKKAIAAELEKTKDVGKRGVGGPLTEVRAFERSDVILSQESEINLLPVLKAAEQRLRTHHPKEGMGMRCSTIGATASAASAQWMELAPVLV